MLHNSIESIVGIDYLSEISEIWRDILAINEVVKSDNFFSLGGDSVMVMSVLMRIEEKYSIYLDPAEIFEFPILEDFVIRVIKALNVDQSIQGTETF